MLACSIDGQLLPPANAMVPVNDHGLLYGDGVFEGLRFYNRRVFRMTRHLERLRASAVAIGLVLPMDDAALSSAVQAVVDASGTDNGYIRLVVTRGSGYMGLDPTHCSHPRTIIIADELAMVSKDKRERGVDVIISSVRRLGADQLDPRIKSLNYLNQIMARMEANAAGADEAIMLNRDGRIAEGSADNVFIVKHGQLLTPPSSEGALEGITRAAVLEVARAQGIPCAEVPLAVHDVYTADECFLTGTGAELIPVSNISGRRVGNGARPVFDLLSSAFKALVEMETRETRKSAKLERV